MKISTIILAAGLGKRMNSALPKVLHPLAGKPLILHALDSAANVGSEHPVVIIGHGAEEVRRVVGDRGRFALQAEQLGTGHAVRQAESLLRGQTDLVLIISADMPLWRAETLQRLVQTQQANPGPLTIMTVISPNSHGFGRVVRGAGGMVQAIVEESQATPEQLKITELNAGAYCCQADWLWGALERLPLSPKGEYYFTDVVGLAVAQELAVEGMICGDVEEALGINNRVHLAEAEAIMRRRINESHMLAGVRLVDPQRTYIEAGVTVGRDTTLWPDTYLRGTTVIGENCQIGPNTIIEDSRVGNGCTLLASVLEGAVVEDDVEMGPFGHLRKGAHLGQGVHMGNFGEVKNSTLASGVKMGHFSYIGDATIGENVNIGAGTITCNFDGVHKNKTIIGKDAFIGSDTMLVAPLHIGEGARTGAGAVVTHDVPPNTVVVGVPARPLPKKEPGE